MKIKTILISFLSVVSLILLGIIIYQYTNHKIENSQLQQEIVRLNQKNKEYNDELKEKSEKNINDIKNAEEENSKIKKGIEEKNKVNKELREEINSLSNKIANLEASLSEQQNANSEDNSEETFYYKKIKAARQRQSDYIDSFDDPVMKQSVQTTHSATIAESNRLLILFPEDGDIIKQVVERVLNGE